MMFDFKTNLKGLNELYITTRDGVTIAIQMNNMEAIELKNKIIKELEI